MGTLWRCNVAAWNLWCAVQTMWHSDSGMRTGLRVADVHAYFEVAAVEPGERKQLFELLQECEREALEVYAEQREIEEKERQRKTVR